MAGAIFPAGAVDRHLVAAIGRLFTNQDRRGRCWCWMSAPNMDLASRPIVHQFGLLGSI